VRKKKCWYMELCHIAFFSCSASNSDDFLVVKNVLHQLTAGAIHDTPFYRLVRTNPGLLTISHIIMYAFYLYWLYGISGMVLLRKEVAEWFGADPGSTDRPCSMPYRPIPSHFQHCVVYCTVCRKIYNEY